MKLYAHYLFTFGILSLFIREPVGLLIALWLSLSVNRLIDYGHVLRNGVPSRSWTTHDVFTAPVWGLAVGILTFYGLRYISIALPVVILMGVVSALSHLLLDSLTEGGVFVLGRRKALAHYRYNSLWLNGAFAFAGMLFLVVWLRFALS